MGWLRQLLSRRRRYDELSASIREHLDEKIADLVDRGMTREQAEQTARREFGNVTRIEERSREVWQWPRMEEILRDVAISVRLLKRSPGFTIVAILTLTLGIGGVVAVFSVVNAVLLRPLPFHNPSQLVRIHEGVEHEFLPGDLPAPDVIRVARENRTFSSVAGFVAAHYEVNGAGGPFEARAERVTASLFPTLGIYPLVGRAFTAREDDNSTPVVVISYALWQQRFHRDSAVVGHTIDLNRRPYKIIGVMPRNFEFPIHAGKLGQQDLWVPMSFTPEERQDETDNFQYGAIARLKPGATLAQAKADVARIIREVQAQIPPADGIQLTSSVDPLSQETTAQAQPILHTLFAAVLCILLIACVNLANLLLVRAAARRREFGMRLALGAPRRTVIRQLLVESLLLSVIGGMLGTGLAMLLVQLARTHLLNVLPRLNGLHISWLVLCVAVLLTAVTGVVCGLAPAFVSAKRDVLEALREGGQAAGPGRSQHRLRSALVVTEIALAMILLTGSALLLRSFANMLAVHPGFQPEHVLTASISLPSETYPTQGVVNAFYRRLQDHISTLPGVEAVGASSNIPIVGIRSDRNFVPVGYVPQNGRTWCSASNYFVMGDYFRAMQIPLLKGRLITAADSEPDAPLVAVVSQATARRDWPGEDPIGRQFRMGGNPHSSRPLITVIGVVGNVRQGALDKAVYPQIYEPLAQVQRQYEPSVRKFIGTLGSMDLVLRTKGNPEALAASLEKTVHQLDPRLAVSRLHTMKAVVASTEVPRRINTAILTAFATIALALALLGIYGVLAYTVAERTREIAIHMAVGATRETVISRILRSALRLAAVGVLCGLLAAAGLTQYMASLLYGVKPLSAVSMAEAAALLLICSALAGLLPARRAASIDPMQALRSE
jgi:predicted permease